jgi:hypothetical protein
VGGSSDAAGETSSMSMLGMGGVSSSRMAEGEVEVRFEVEFEEAGTIEFGGHDEDADTVDMRSFMDFVRAGEAGGARTRCEEEEAAEAGDVGDPCNECNMWNAGDVGDIGV